WVKHSERGVNIPLIQMLIQPLDSFQVLLRHRLLLQAEVGEGLLARRHNRYEASHLGVTNMEQARALWTCLLNSQATRFPARGEPMQHQDALMVKLSERFDLRDSKVVPPSQPASETF